MRSKRRGALIIDVLIGFLVFGMGVAAFFATMPIFQSGQMISRNETIATQIANRMIEHLQTLRPQQLTPEVLEEMNLIEFGQTAGPYTFTHMPMDEASRYSPAQMLPEADAKLALVNIGSGSVRAEITISWKNPRAHAQTVKTGTIVGGYK